MDLPVVLIKLRDYLFWFGPAYLVAISLGAASEVILRRLLALPYAPTEIPTKSTSGAVQRITSIERNLLLEAWLRKAGGSNPQQRVSLQLYLWASLTAQSVSWMALLVTAQFGGAISLLRLGFALIIASLLAAIGPLLFRGGKALSTTVAGVLDAPLDVSRLAEGVAAPMPLVEWWRLFQKRFNDTSNGFVLAAGLGALLFGLVQSIYSPLRVVLATDPISYLLGSAVGMALPFAPGTDVPLVAALQTRGGDSIAFAFMLAVSASSWGLLRTLKNAVGMRGMLSYLAAAWILVAVMAQLFSFLTSALGPL